jgi:hypothetical protein
MFFSDIPPVRSGKKKSKKGEFFCLKREKTQKNRFYTVWRKMDAPEGSPGHAASAL